MDGGNVRADALHTTMGELARALHREHGSVDDTLAAIAAAAVVSVPGATSAGITLISRRKKLENRAATDELPKRVAELQTDSGEGPCLESLHEQRAVRVDDMATADRVWADFGKRVAELPVRSMLSVPLYVQHGSLGSLSLYSPEPGAFDEQAEEIGAVLASHAAVALVGAQNEEGLRLALDNRDLIGQAKGILMERFKITGQEAFLLLVTVSQHRNVKLRDVAEQLTATGELPSAEPGG
jgi:GAF domain-containing protein